MKFIFPAAVISAFGFATPMLAQDNPVVVELYTSQGCSSCPPADALLLEIADREDVIALALHVDYWDYIGWVDPFADPAHAKRQRAYAASRHSRSVYTPEMVVMGQTDILGTEPMKLSAAIADHADAAQRVALDVQRDGDEVVISARPLDEGLGAMTVHMLRYTPLRTTRIKRGENRGKTLNYANVVEGWQVLGTWDGVAPLEMRQTAPGDKPVVVILQAQAMGPILAAARVK